ncbi:response regulator transcription factor [Nonomuraea sp. NPDC048882]|uniref:response regulator transcription factor n=1 Tax=Nonomuraea sp. NPDC048882 TaxID=3154347 RepID=UPI0033E2534B
MHTSSANVSAEPVRRPGGGAADILVVAGEPALTKLRSTLARQESWRVRGAYDGGAATRAARCARPDAVVLDATMPGAADVRLPGVPVLYLTTTDRLDEELAGLGAGAGDYVTKPFRVEEVVARLHRLLRRARVARRDGAGLVVGDLTLDQRTRRARRDGEDIRLSPTEYELLRLLMRNPGRVLSKAHILDRVWAYDFGGRGNVVELYISYLRRKIDARRAPMIHTVRGVGYTLRPAAGGGVPVTPAGARRTARSRSGRSG